MVTFHSKAAADVTMYEKHAEPLLQLLNKDVKRGVITAEETGPAIALLEGEVRRSETMPLHDDVHPHVHAEDEDPEGPQRREPVRFAARVYPFLDMLREAHRKHCDVLWGVVGPV